MFLGTAKTLDAHTRLKARSLEVTTHIKDK
jgi:hypothetical protein